MLTGRESVGAALAAVAHRRASSPALWREGRQVSWSEVGVEVRSLALGLMEEGLRPGEPRAVTGGRPDQRFVAALALLSVGAVLVEGDDRPGEKVEATGLDELRRRGTRADDRHPSRYEELWQAVGPADIAVTGTGGELSHDGLLRAGLSFVQALDIAATDRILCTLEDRSGIVVGLVVPVLTGAAIVADPAPSLAPSPPLPTVAVLGAGGGGRLDSTALPALAGCRAALVADSDTSTARMLSALGVRAHAALAVTGVAGLVTGLDGSASMGRPLPGVTVAVDDDGEILVRAPGAPVAAGEGGWVRTGRRGELEGDRLILGPVSKAAG